LFANKLGCLCQGIGTGPNNSKRVKVTNTLFLIMYDKIPAKRHREITYSRSCARSNLRREMMLTILASPLAATTSLIPEV
jgi:hypothetical protein